MTSLPLADQVGGLLLIDFLVGGLAYFLVRKNGGYPTNLQTDLYKKAKQGSLPCPRCFRPLNGTYWSFGRIKGLALNCPVCGFREY